MDKKIISDHFGLSKEELEDQSVCVAKSSFKINKSIDFERLINVVEGCEVVFDTLKPIPINSVKRIVKKRKLELIGKLEGELYTQLWDRFQDQNYEIDFDLCHKETDRYLTASKYIVGKSADDDFIDTTFSKLENIDEIFAAIKKTDKCPTRKFEFEILIKNLKIFSFDENGHQLTKGSIFQHLFGDISLEEEKFFFIHNNWYQIEKDFLLDLDKSCEQFISERYIEGILDEIWNSQDDENSYNQKYLGGAKTLVLDKIVPDLIEPCDILKWDEENLYLCHVKKGFGNTMRDLCSQIFIAANRLLDQSSSGSYLEKIYDHVSNKVGNSDPYFNKVGEQSKKINKSTFLELFKKRKIFVFCIMDSNKKSERSIRAPMKNFRSNIAKFSLQELVKGMRGIGVELQITQISRK